MTAARASFQFCSSHVFSMSCQSFITTALISYSKRKILSLITNDHFIIIYLEKNPHIITLVILLCVCVKYFFWVFSKSSGPPAIARIMLSAIRLSWRQSSTAPSKFPVSRACVMSPSTSDRQAQMYFKFVTKCDVHSH